MNAVSVQSAPLEAQAERRSLDELWQMAAALKPRRIDVESPAIFSPFGLPPCTQVSLIFQRDGDSLRITAVEIGLHSALERVIEKATAFGIRP